VPVVSVILGFGSGTGASTKAEDTGRGTGLGGGGYVSPESLLVITKAGEVHVLEAKKGGLSEALKTIVPAVVESMRGKKEQREPAK
jgi:uncharacterized spore protein YtfJ